MESKKKIKLKKPVKKILAALLSSTFLTLLVVLFSSPSITPFPQVAEWVEKLENIFYDSLFKWASLTSENEETVETEGVTVSQLADPNIYIVDIDEPSLVKLGPYNTWSRNIHADVVKSLNDGGASAILFDILFKTADFGAQQTEKTITALNTAIPGQDWDSLATRLKHSFNDDSVLLDAIVKNKNTVVSYLFENGSAYQHKSQWEGLSTPLWQQAIQTKNAMDVSQADLPEKIESKELIDNIFPELSEAAVAAGAVNAYPDQDGVIRRISLFHRFPNPELYSEYTKIYPSLTLATVLHLYGQKAENVKIHLGKYVDLGQPFGFIRNASSGKLESTYPQFSYPMFRALLKELQENKHLEKSDEQMPFLQPATRVVVSRHDEEYEIEILDGQVLTPRLSAALLTLSEHKLKDIGKTEIEIQESITIKQNEEVENQFVLFDSEEEEEAIISTYTVSVLDYFKDSIANLPNNTPVRFSCDLDISYDLSTKKWRSNFIILSDDVLRDIREHSITDVAYLKKGDEIRFGKNIKVPIDENGQFRITYGSRFNTAKARRSFYHLSYYDVAKRRLDPGLYEGKIFILGSAATALFDFVTAPHEENYPGVLVHASVLENILRGRFLVNLEWHWQLLIIVFIALFCTLVALYLRNYFLFPGILILVAVLAILGNYAFSKGLYLGFAEPTLVLLFTTISALLIKTYFESKDKQFLNDAFKQYISPALIQEMLDKEIKPQLGGVKSELTAYFTDIAGFSTFSEKIADPTRLVELLNEYLGGMTDILLKNRGTLDKYEGDAIIAFFGAPMKLPNHAQSACETAVSMQEKLLELRKKWIQENDKWPTPVKEMHMRIGINSGDIVTGNMGSAVRKNYTMMGDAVNLAARLESAAKQYGAYIQISETTKNLLEPNSFLYRSLDIVRVVGKSEPVRTYELLARNDGSEQAKEIQKLIDIWEKGREAYCNTEWDKAIECFKEAELLEPHHPDKDPGSKTTPSAIYIARCEEYKKSPPVRPGTPWDGIYTATAK
ncbi:MAG: CHASE2 domain-containing protein [Fibrobacteraceae bacterium]|nr:CHASE2 domain-containing protein [Fibrobacteraceae bacterium]